MDKFKQYFEQNKKLSILIIFGTLFLCCLCTMVFYFIGVNLPPEIDLRGQSSTSWDSTDPIATIQLECTVADSITINDTSLAQDGIDSICGNGYQVELSDGKNTFQVVASNQNGTDQIDITISFDKTAYDARIAKEEAKKLEEERLAAEESKRKEKEEAEERAKAEAEANKPRVGDSLSGPSFDEIQDEYNRQNDLSSYKGEQYLESLRGKRVVWIAEVSDVDDQIFGDDLYVSLSLTTALFETDIAFVYNPRPEFLQLDSGTKVKVTGTIDEINKGIFGLTTYLDRDTKFEIVD